MYKLNNFTTFLKIDHTFPWFIADFSELKQNKQAYTQPVHPTAYSIFIANNYASNTQNMQILKHMTQYIESYIENITSLQIKVNTSFDVQQLKYVNSLLQNKQLKVRCNNSIS